MTLLDPAERGRYYAYRHAKDRARFLTGTALVRRQFAADFGVPAAAVRLDRSCPDCDRPHGKVRLADSRGTARQQVEVSVSHSGRWVVVAVCRAHPLGVDVERVDPSLDFAGVGRIAMTETELGQLRRLPIADRAAAFTRLWVRKEAVVKAIGEGLRTPLADIEVSSADTPPRVVAWPTRPELAGRLQLHDLACGSEHRAALAVLDAAPLQVLSRDAGQLLGTPVDTGQASMGLELSGEV